MSCSVEDYMLQEYLDGTLDPLTKIIIEEHLKTCQSCKREITELKLLMWELNSLPDPVAPSQVAYVRTKVLNQIFGKSAHIKPLREFLVLQKRIFHQATFFVKYVPTAKLIGNGLKRTPRIAGKLVNEALKSSVITMAMRFQS